MTIRDEILNYLHCHPNRTHKQIWEDLFKVSRPNTKVQAVYPSLKKLMEDGLISRQGDPFTYTATALPYSDNGLEKMEGIAKALKGCSRWQSANRSADGHGKSQQTKNAQFNLGQTPQKIRIVIQCGGRKNTDKPFLDKNGNVVEFSPKQNLPWNRSDIPGPTWIELVKAFNSDSSKYPFDLQEAAKLYRNTIYTWAANHIGKPEVFILSAGWGLVRVDYLIPNYDITFKAGVPGSVRGRSLRGKTPEHFSSYLNHLPNDAVETHLFIGKDYYRQAIYLAGNKANTTLHYRVPPQGKSSRPVDGFSLYQPHPMDQSTNWYVEALKHFLNGNVPPPSPHS